MQVLVHADIGVAMTMQTHKFQPPGGYNPQIRPVGGVLLSVSGMLCSYVSQLCYLMHVTILADRYHLYCICVYLHFPHSP